MTDHPDILDAIALARALKAVRIAAREVAGTMLAEGIARPTVEQVMRELATAGAHDAERDEERDHL